MSPSAPLVVESRVRARESGAGQIIDARVLSLARGAQCGGAFRGNIVRALVKGSRGAQEIGSNLYTQQPRALLSWPTDIA